MKKQNLKEETDHPKKVSWSKLGEMNREEVKESLEAHGRLLIYTLDGDIFELRGLDL
jgi:hypothetical protein